MREEAGAENFFLFGLTVEEVERIEARRLPSRRLVLQL
jgi:glucan phosphorylase